MEEENKVRKQEMKEDRLNMITRGVKVDNLY